MKRSNIFVIVLSLFLAFAFQFTNAQTVYVTESGKKFHKKNCSIVKEGKKGMEMSEAKKQGLEPCKVCYSSSTSTTSSKQEAIEPKKKK